MADDSKTARRRRKLDEHELVAQLNEMIAQLIKENRKLRREVDKLTARGTAVASTTVDRGLRTLQRRVQRALTTTTKRRRKPSANGRRTRRRKKAA